MADTRKCIGSAKFGIEAHDAPTADFPAQPSQKDGIVWPNSAATMTA